MRKVIEKINRNAILAGIISTVLFIYFLEPILSFLGRLLIFFYKSVSQSLYDRLFGEIALGKPDYSYSLLQITMILSLNFLLLITFRPPNRAIKKRIFQRESENKEITLADIQNKITRLKKFITRLRLFMKIFASIVVLVSIFSMAMSDIKLSTIQSFEQQIKIITPYIDQRTKDLFISDFSRMKSSNDFEKIQNSIKNIALKNEIILPKVRHHFF
jgi:hypothetical protein